MKIEPAGFAKLSPGLGLLALALGAPAYAQEAPVYRAEEVVVTATRIPQKVSQSLQNVSVITADEIAESGQQTLVEVLQAKGGVEITNAGGFGKESAVRIRGAESRHTMVLVDGLRIDSATTGSTAFENIPLNQIERIEIVPGPLSSLYGSDAIGGVIQIFTRSGKYSSGIRASAGGGSFGTFNLSGGINSNVKDTDFSLNLGHFETDGFDATKPSIPFGQHNPDRDGYRNTNFSGKLAHHFTPAHEAGLTLFQSEGTTHTDSGSVIAEDISRQRLGAYSAYSRNRITEAWQSLVRVGRGRDNFAASGDPGLGFFARTDQDQFTWQNDVKLGVGTVLAGVEYRKQKVKSDTAFAQTRRTIRSAFGGYSGEYGNHGWQINGRLDDNSQFGDHATGSVGYGYRFTSNLRLRASAGTAFKAPTFNDLFFPLFFGFSGNPNLRPERSRSWEAGIDFQAGSHRFSATYFDNRITDLIVTVFDPVTFSGSPQNVNKARIKGAELGYQGELGGVRLAAQLTLQDPVDAVTDKLLPRRARGHGSVAVSRAFGPWKLGGEVIGNGARFDSTTEAPGTRMGGYGLVNLTASYGFARDWSVNARWNNVFDRNYELVQHFNTPGSNVFVALQYQPR